MTATAAALSREPRFTLIHGGAQEGFLAQVRNAASRAWGWFTSAPGRFWGWFKDTLHLQPAVNFVKDGARSTFGVMRATRDAMGIQGLSGLGMLTISTASGRKVGGFLLKPLEWLVRGVAWVWDETKIFLLGHLGSPGSWVANRMGDWEDLMIGEDGISGVTGSVMGFYFKHVSRHFKLDGTAMRIVRLVGTALFGAQLIYAVAALPWLLGGYLVATQWILAAGFAASCMYQGYRLGEHVAPMLQVQWDKFSDRDKATKTIRRANVRYSAVPRDRQPAKNNRQSQPAKV
jgi:hypothetical protein